MRHRLLQVLVFLACMLAGSSSVAFAQGGGGCGGGGGGGGGCGGGGGSHEGAGNNLSFPMIFAEALGLGGEPIDVATGLREPPGGEDSFAGVFWYGWLVDDQRVVCDPTTPACPPPGGGLQRLWVQNDERNVWQAGWQRAADGVPVLVDGVKWGDNLMSHQWTTTSHVRVETVLYRALESPLLAYEMWHLTGSASSEVQGVRTSNDPVAPVPVRYPSGQATVFSPCARLTIQKLAPGLGQPSGPPVWNPAGASWEGASLVVLSSAAWQRFGQEGPGTYGFEVNKAGVALAGYSWKVGETSFPPSVNRAGWYRLTLSFDPTGVCGGASPIVLNTSLAAAAVVAGEDEEGHEGPRFTPVVDQALGIAWIDIQIASASGCGDGVLAGDEACDDGNTSNGDCCSATCTLEPAGSPCGDDGNVCTTDACTAIGTCAHQPNTATCDDGDACTGGDVCDAGSCRGAPVECGECHACDPAIGCTVVADGSACTDHDACTVGESCLDGVCGGGGDVECAACESCEPSAGCRAAPLDTCRTPTVSRAARLVISANANDPSRDRLLWQWRSHASMTMGELLKGPDAGPYDLCVFVGAGKLALAVTAGASGLCTRPGGACWRASRSGLSYSGPLASGPGRVRLALRPGRLQTSRSFIRVQGSGRGLALPLLPVARPITVQLRNRDSGLCWSAEHHDVHRNDPRHVVATGD